MGGGRQEKICFANRGRRNGRLNDWSLHSGQGDRQVVVVVVWRGEIGSMSLLEVFRRWWGRGLAGWVVLGFGWRAEVKVLGGMFSRGLGGVGRERERGKLCGGQIGSTKLSLDDHLVPMQVASFDKIETARDGRCEGLFVVILEISATAGRGGVQR